MKTKYRIMGLACAASFLTMNVVPASAQDMVCASSVNQRRTALRDSILSHISGAKMASKTLSVLKFGAKETVGLIAARLLPRPSRRLPRWKEAG